jgi:hypothetical protein
MLKENYKRFCKHCKALIRKENAENQKRYRLRVKGVESKPERVKINKGGDK